jgi:SlyX protein
MTASARLDDLEIRITHLERSVQELSDVLIRQQKELDRILERNQILADRLATLEDPGETPMAPAEPPPHY